jgi:hypothetical protein
MENNDAIRDAMTLPPNHCRLLFCAASVESRIVSSALSALNGGLSSSGLRPDLSQLVLAIVYLSHGRPEGQFPIST